MGTSPSLESVCSPPEQKKILLRECVICKVLTSRTRFMQKGLFVMCSEGCEIEYLRQAKEVANAEELASIERSLKKRLYPSVPRLSRKQRRNLKKKNRKKIREELRKNPEKKNEVKYLATRFKNRYGKSFYTSEEWMAVRWDALKRSGWKCVSCGASKNEARLHVDHIKPRSTYPELELAVDNLQVLCEPCNLGKKNRDETDLRKL